MVFFYHWLTLLAHFLSGSFLRRITSSSAQFFSGSLRRWPCFGFAQERQLSEMWKLFLSYTITLQSTHRQRKVLTCIIILLHKCDLWCLMLVRFYLFLNPVRKFMYSILPLCVFLSCLVCSELLVPFTFSPHIRSEILKFPKIRSTEKVCIGQ